MDKEGVVHQYNGILLSHQKEWNNAICSNMVGLETGILSEVETSYDIPLYVESKKIWYKWTYL